MGQIDKKKILLARLDRDDLRPNERLFIAVHNNLVDVLSQAVDQGADVNFRTEQHPLTPLMIACKEGAFDCAKALLNLEADIHAVSRRSGLSALYFAAYACPADLVGQLEVVRQLLAKGLPADARGNTKCATPLMGAVAARNKICVELLIDHGADLEAVDERGMTPLLRVIEDPDGSDEILRILLERGANPNARRDDGKGVWEIVAMHDSLIQSEIEHIFLDFAYMCSLSEERSSAAAIGL